jgi:hypothetical protein
MRALLLAIVLAMCLVPPAYGTADDVHARLRYRIGDFFPSELDSLFPASFLTGGGCMTVYLHGVTTNGCPVLRGESSWVNFEIWWDGPRPLQLTRSGDQLLITSARRAPLWQSRALPMTWHPTPGVEQTPTGFVLEPHSRMVVRIDLSDTAATAPAGNYELCFAPALAPGQSVQWAAESDGCHIFWLREITNTRLRLEYLRRQSIELLSAGRCDDAGGLVDEMLTVHPVSAVAYRLRGIIAELQRRVADAALDTAQAANLLKAGADRLLIFSEPERQRLGDELQSWSESLQFADPMNGWLGPPGKGAPECH